MSFQKTAAVAALSVSMFFGTQAMASLSEDRAAVLVAMNQRFSELTVEIAALRATLPSLSGAERRQARKEIRLLTTRKNQLRSFSRIVNRYPRPRLERVVDYFGLSVSLS